MKNASLETRLSPWVCIRQRYVCIFGMVASSFLFFLFFSVSSVSHALFSCKMKKKGQSYIFGLPTVFKKYQCLSEFYLINIKWNPVKRIFHVCKPHPNCSDDFFQEASFILGVPLSLETQGSFWLYISKFYEKCAF